MDHTDFRAARNGGLSKRCYICPLKHSDISIYYLLNSKHSVLPHMLYMCVSYVSQNGERFLFYVYSITGWSLYRRRSVFSVN
jgi:hypothetical protein